MKSILKLVGVIAYFLYLHAFYYVILVPAFAEYSFYAFLIVPFVLLAIWLLPSSYRKIAFILTLLYPFVDQAMMNVKTEGTLMMLLAALVLFLFLYPLLLWYTKHRKIWTYVAAAVILSLSLQLIVPLRAMQALPVLAPIWVSEPQYYGDFYGHLPLQVADVNGDGQEEIVTLGNRDFFEDDQEKPTGYRLYTEPLRVMAWSWQNGTFNPDTRR